jgi:hypothetical protein
MNPNSSSQFGRSAPRIRFSRVLTRGQRAFYQAALLTVVAAGGTILAWRFAGGLAASGRADIIAKEIGSVADLGLGGGAPVPDHRGEKLAFFRTTLNGVGLFECDLTTGRQRPIYEQSQEQYETNTGYVRLLNWSPDDGVLAFTRRAKELKEREIVIWEEATQAEEGAVVVRDGLNQFAWLSSDAFAYLNKKQELRIITRLGGVWVEGEIWGQLCKSSIKDFTAVSTNAVAWLEDGAVWRLDLGSLGPAKLWEGKSNSLTSFSYCSSNGKFLLNCQQGKSERLMSLDAKTGSLAELGVISENRSPIVWANSGQGCAYLSRTATGSALAVMRGFGGERVWLFSLGAIRGWATSAGGERIYALASAKDEAPGVWEYELSSDVLRRVMPAAEEPLRFSRWVPGLHGWVPGETKASVPYHLWPPAHYKRGNKYPLVLGGINATPYAEAVANAGGYFVSVDRASASGRGAEDWWADVMTVRAELLRKPSIDASRVYLFGAGWETEQLAKILAKEPEGWKGVILFSPDGLPRLSGGRLPRMLIDAGMNDSRGVKRLSEYQEEARKFGITAKLELHEHLGRTAWGEAATRARMLPLLMFVFGV